MINYQQDSKFNDERPHYLFNQNYKKELDEEIRRDGKDAQQKCMESYDDVRSLKENIGILSRENMILREKLKTSLSINRELEREVDETKQDLNGFKKEYIQLQEQVDEMLIEEEKARAREEALRESLFELQEEMRSERREGYDSWTRKQQDEQSDLLQLMEERAFKSEQEQRQQQKQFESEKRDILSRLKQANEDLKQKKKELNVQKQEMKSLKDQIDEHNKENLFYQEKRRASSTFEFSEEFTTKPKKNSRKKEDNKSFYKQNQDNSRIEVLEDALSAQNEEIQELKRRLKIKEASEQIKNTKQSRNYSKSQDEEDEDIIISNKEVDQRKNNFANKKRQNLSNLSLLNNEKVASDNDIDDDPSSVDQMVSKIKKLESDVLNIQDSIQIYCSQENLHDFNLQPQHKCVKSQQKNRASTQFSTIQDENINYATISALEKSLKAHHCNLCSKFPNMKCERALQMESLLKRYQKLRKQ